jgi:uncharacterized protein YjiS (DUF1127 family)
MPLVGIISNPISEWQRRVRCRRELESLSDATLRDIGIMRCDYHRGMKKPFWMAWPKAKLHALPTSWFGASGMVQDDFMEHRGVRYAIRIGIERKQWRVAIQDPGTGFERTVFGTREDAEMTARSMINAWLKKRPALLK